MYNRARACVNLSLREHKTNQEVRQLAGVEGIEKKLTDARLHHIEINQKPKIFCRITCLWGEKKWKRV